MTDAFVPDGAEWRPVKFPVASTNTAGVAASSPKNSTPMTRLTSPRVPRTYRIALGVGSPQYEANHKIVLTISSSDNMPFLIGNPERQ
jgi:hypothetical protein